MLAILAHLKTLTPQFFLSHHLQREILMKMLFFKPSDRLLEAEKQSEEV